MNIKRCRIKVKYRKSTLFLHLLVPILLGFGTVNCGLKNKGQGTPQQSGLKKSAARAAAENLAIAVAMDAAQSPTQDLVIWIEDEKGGRNSYWLRGNAVEVTFLAVHPGIAIPTSKHLWKWQETQIEVADCDCTAWKADNFQETCPESEELLTGTQIQLFDPISSESLILPQTLGSTTDTGDPQLVYSSKASPIATVGPYLFYRIDEKRIRCKNAQQIENTTYFVFDYESKKVVDILSETEKERIYENEQLFAMEISDNQLMSRSLDANAMTLVAVLPKYGEDFSLFVSYQFVSKRQVDIPQDRSSTAYKSTISIPAKQLPETLIPYALPPIAASLGTLGAKNIQRGGRHLIEGSGEHVAALWKNFVSTETETTGE